MQLSKRLLALGLLVSLTLTTATVNAQKRPAIAPRPFVAPSSAVPAPLGTRVPVIFDRPWYHDNRGYGYGYGGIGFGFGIGFDGFYGDPFWAPGFFAAVPFYGYNGFYSNGYSMYGPPVPTYAPIPGVFGAGDYRIYGNYPVPDYGSKPMPLFSSPYNTGGDLKVPPPLADTPLTPLVPSVPLPQIPATPLYDNALAKNQQAGATAPLTMDFIVPESAKVYFDDNLTKQTGKIRTYASPDWNVGEVLEYKIRVDWTENGVPLRRERKVTGKAGEKITVDFTKD
jgi:uncharacterized protein (TIGR03000 family)